MSWLVTGAAGYIGAHVVARLHAAGEAVVGLDNLSTGYAERLPAGVPLVRADVSDATALRATLVGHGVTGVMHLAGVKSAPESTRLPMYYYRQNVGAVAVLLEAMTDTGVARLVFSSSAAVYGSPRTTTVTEESSAHPVNPYGQSKLAAEQLIGAAALAYGLSWTALRYFNAVGAHSPLLADRGTANLLPLAFHAVRTGEPLTVAGRHFATPDGTGVRDFVHVSDIAEAHHRVGQSGLSGVYNVGTGRGYSVLDVLAAVEVVTGLPVPHRFGPARPGDPGAVVADAGKLRRELGWQPAHTLLEAVASAAPADLRARHAAGTAPALPG
ncbi:MAG: UDP-glucose 4-epimerase [Actinoplanes sp.]|jgi:UDP-glucose 4-epimerase|nr:UDP-glucose 4-epimerase [Actinoplanes sp.]